MHVSCDMASCMAATFPHKIQQAFYPNRKNQRRWMAASKLQLTVHSSIRVLLVCCTAVSACHESMDLPGISQKRLEMH